MIRKILFIILLFIGIVSAQLIGDIKIAAIRVSFLVDNHDGTSGDGSFLLTAEYDTCGSYTIDPPPHNKSYFSAQLTALDNYFSAVSYDNFGIDLTNSRVFPDGENNSYQLADSMSHYHRFGEDDLYEQRITELLRDAVQVAFSQDGMDFSEYDLIVVFHAGIGQDFKLPFIDPTPEDIPSTYVDPEMIAIHLDAGISVGGVSITKGLILPETQNHLLYESAELTFSTASEPCDFQYGLTGTFALLTGFARGLPPLWNIETGQSGVGIFGLMDQGSNNGRGVIPAPPTAWTRIYAGWEVPQTVSRDQINLPARGNGNLVKVIINDTEYFLIENRTNWIHDDVSIDSIRWQLYNEDKAINDDDARFPPYIEIIMDSVDKTIDETGVITAVLNYDLGLPASGLLIWHIDEDLISQNIGSNQINADNAQKGVALEEADGAQDIGFESIFMFTDPSSGLFADMWYQGNPERDRLYPELKGLPLEFGPYTHPDTRSNSGATTFIQFSNIGQPDDTMSFAVENLFFPDDLPDSTLNMRFSVDLDNDGSDELIGGSSQLWWSHQDLIMPMPFYDLVGSQYELVAVGNNLSGYCGLGLAEIRTDSLIVSLFRFNPTTELVESLWSWKFEADNDFRIIGSATGDTIFIEMFDMSYSLTADELLGIEIELASQSIGNFTNLLNPAADNKYNLNWDNLIESHSNGEDHWFYSPEMAVISFAVADLDGDSYSELLVLDETGNLIGLNHNLTLLPGFPIALNGQGNIFIRNLTDSESPEIVVQNTAGEIVIFNSSGQEIYRLANPYSDEIQILTNFQGRSSIISQSTVWMFDSLEVENGNQWNLKYGNRNNSLIVHTNIPPVPQSAGLFDPQRTYSYPNPARGDNIKFRIFVKEALSVNIRIFDLAGLFVDELTIDDPVKFEANEILWNVAQLESGIYFANIEVKGVSESNNKILKIGVIH